MESNRWKQVDSLLQAALDLPAGELDGFLEKGCKGDEALELEVRSLLTAHQKAGSFLDGAATEVAAPSITQSGYTGRTVSHYKILEMLGSGGMGVVYKAFDTKLDRFVALKFLAPHMRHDLELKRRLTEEARAASTLDHPNIVVIHDIDEAPDGDLFIAMAFHEGETLQQRIREKRLPVAEALQITRQIASGLSKAHERGLFHRDIKPSNVIVAKDGVARIIDFGLAKSSEASITMDGSTKGTPLYMSPEQASGKAVDFRTDLWSLGSVLYEMLAGSPPFPGHSHFQVMHDIMQKASPRIREKRPDLPSAIDRIISMALEKDPSKRYQSAADMVRDSSAALAALDATADRPHSLRAAYAIPLLILTVLLAALSLWFYQRSEKRTWARLQAIPEIVQLSSENKNVAAYRLVQKAQQYLPGDPQLLQASGSLTHTVSIKSSPPGATVEIKDYLSPDDAWVALGITPLVNVPVPNGYLRWKVSKVGVGEYSGAPVTEDIHGWRREFNFDLEPIAKTPPGMVPVPGGRYENLIWGMGYVGPYELPAFYIDQYEVTNRQYQEFVDKGGYQKREYWKEKFTRDGKELSWEQAMDLFRDSTGRPAPSGWQAGHSPTGQADLPVGGVSWYEAAAYAEFAGKSLPVIHQWHLAAPSPVARFITKVSNFSNAALASPGKFSGLGPWGTYDMAGNVAEWCRNEDGHNFHYILGGAWNTSNADYYEPEALQPFNRLPNNGFRCVRNLGPIPAQASAEARILARDFSKIKPVTDEVFKIYKGMYAYDHSPLNARMEPIEQNSPDWRKEKITFDAAYGKERMAAYLFLPAKIKPPYQTVVFFPSARVLDLADSKTLGDTQFIDFVIQSGRAVLYPVYKGTYERQQPNVMKTPTMERDEVIQQSKDLGRSIDFLDTRSDIDHKRMAYMGVSMAASWGVVFTALETRFRAVIFLDGGFFEGNPLPGIDQADFAPRLKAPVIMIGGKYDWFQLGRDSMLRMFGTPPADKKAVLLDTAHNVSEQRSDLVREVVAWLDKYLGKVN